MVSQVCYGKKKNKHGILGTSYDARISELKQQISILENEKCEVEGKLSSYMEGLKRRKKMVITMTL